jgi:uncharacterized LabA/DUF88 family protein
VTTRTPRHAPGDDSRRLAVLIDADNAQPSIIEGLLAEVAKFGIASSKRIYGDWTSTAHTQWKKALLRNSITPIQQFAYTRGKNATDSSMIIDAMDLMYTRRFDGFCLVSSDSDFTRLAQRLREEGLTVYGFGERKTPDSFSSACDKFIYTELLQDLKPTAATSSSTSSETTATVRQSPANAAASAPDGVGSRGPEFPLELVRQAVRESTDDSGWAALGAVGSYLTKLRPEFDARLYGAAKLSDLLRGKSKHFLLEERGSPGASSKPVYVRLKQP